MKTTLATVLSFLMLAGNALAAATIDTAVIFNSGILVIAFAGFLALVVVVQTIPALISLYGMIKGAAEAAKQNTVVETTN